jgi:hypothetical protein
VQMSLEARTQISAYLEALRSGVDSGGSSPMEWTTMETLRAYMPLRQIVAELEPSITHR